MTASWPALAIRFAANCSPGHTEKLLEAKRPAGITLAAPVTLLKREL